MQFRKLFLLFVVCLTPLAVAAGETPTAPARLDWNAWQRLPVFHSGRMMPLNTFARMAVDQIAGRANPELAPPDGPGTSASDAAVLFPEGKPRRFQAAELLFSWLVEPQRWEQVPFLESGHETLLTEVLELPVTDARGNHVKFVSPAQVRNRVMAVRMCLADVAMKQQKAKAQGRTYALTEKEARLNKLFDAYTLYRMLTFQPDASSEDADGHGRFMQRLNSLVDTWNKAGEDIHGMGEADPSNQAAALIAATEESLQKLIDLAKGDELTLAKTEPVVVKLHESTSALAKQFAEHNRQLFENPPKDWSEAQLKRVRTRVHALASSMADMARESNEAHIALYDSGHALRLVPALNPAALEQNRDVANDAQPWLSLPALLKGSDQLLAGYPKDSVAAVRAAFQGAADAYVKRDNPDRASQFNGAIERLSTSLRTLGEQAEPIRRELPIQKRDEALLTATAYPPPEATWAEVHYYQFSPFLWSWVVGACALACFGLSFGVIRKPMFWLGMAVLFAAQLFTIYGFALRVYITGWAPVTNMFETVMFVALVVSLLGVLFVLGPILWPGLRNAWRLTAVPGTWEATPLTPEQQQLLSPAGWNALSVGLLLPRIAAGYAVFKLLALTPYGSGNGYTVVSLLPRTDVGSSVPTLNDVTVWLVGMLLLVAAVWYVPRAILAGLVGLVTVPYTLAKEGIAKPLEHSLARKPFAWAGASVGLLTGLVAFYAPVFDQNINPLMPVLRDNFWLTLHVLTITASYGAGALAWGLGNIALGYYLFGKYRDPLPQETPEGHRPADPQADHAAPTRRPPEACAALGTFNYKSMQVAVLLLAAGTILGGLWADVSWGRFWGWDPKEVWALASLLIYLAVLHGRYAGWFGNFGLAVGSVIGATSILMAWYGVNFWLGSGLHSYGEGTGGALYVLAAVVVNWLLILPAALRYLLETTAPPK
jgi:ABC-type transport system involved in cytochrome c biogenesis permease subunit